MHSFLLHGSHRLPGVDGFLQRGGKRCREELGQRPAALRRAIIVQTTSAHAIVNPTRRQHPPGSCAGTTRSLGKRYNNNSVRAVLYTAFYQHVSDLLLRLDYVSRYLTMYSLTYSLLSEVVAWLVTGSSSVLANTWFTSYNYFSCLSYTQFVGAIGYFHQRDTNRKIKKDEEKKRN